MKLSRTLLLLILLLLSFVTVNSVSKRLFPGKTTYGTSNRIASPANLTNVPFRTNASPSEVRRNMPHAGGALIPAAGIPSDASVGVAGSVSAPASLLKGSSARKGGSAFTSTVIASASAPVKANALTGGVFVAGRTGVARLKSAFTAVHPKVPVNGMPDAAQLAAEKAATAAVQADAPAPVAPQKAEAVAEAPIAEAHASAAPVAESPVTETPVAQTSAAPAPGARSDKAYDPADFTTAPPDQSADDQLVNLLSTQALDHYELSMIALDTKAAFKQPTFTDFDPTKGPMGIFVDSIRNSLMDPHGVQFGAIGGINWSGASAFQASGKVTGRPLGGFNLGLFADIPFKNKSFSLRPSLEYSYEGFQADLGGNNVNIHVAYLTLPVDLVYHTHLLSRRFYIGAGPYAAYALNGEYSFKGINTSFQFGSNPGPDNVTRMDVGADLMAGLLLDRNFTLGAKFDYGFLNISSSGTNAQVRSRSFGLSLGYVFRNRANSTIHQTSSFKY